MATVDIGSESYDSFADVDFADVYIAADPISADGWGDLGDDGKGQLLVTATRVLKRQDWRDGVPSFSATPDPIREATVEFAAALVAGYDLAVPAASVLPVRRQKAGPVEVEYFRDLDNPAYRPPPLPPAVWALIRPYLKGEETGTGTLPGSIATGTCGSSITERYNRMDDRIYYGFGPGDRDYN